MNKLFFLLFLICLVACSQQEKKSVDLKVVSVVKSPLTTSLYYNGSIQPLKSTWITSPIEGTITAIYFHYGDPAKKGQALLSIFSEKFQTDYKTALMQYIKAKLEFNNAKSQLSENEFLHKNQLISEDDFKNKKSVFYSAQLNFVDAKETLAQLLKQLNLTTINPEQLTIEDIDAIVRALHLSEQSKTLQIIAPAAGTILEGGDSSDVKPKKITLGQAVKPGDVLAIIGDTTGIKVHIDVDEFSINQIHLGQTVAVSGNAFPQLTLTGKITEIDRQAATDKGPMPLFPVEITVPQLKDEAKRSIQMGMTAKVEIQSQRGALISVPISAVFEKNGQAYVNVQTAEHQIVPQLVKTAETTANSVVIESGLKEGDHIVLSP